MWARGWKSHMCVPWAHLACEIWRKPTQGLARAGRGWPGLEKPRSWSEWAFTLFIVQPLGFSQLAQHSWKQPVGARPKASSRDLFRLWSWGAAHSCPLISWVSAKCSPPRRRAASCLSGGAFGESLAGLLPVLPPHSPFSMALIQPSGLCLNVTSSGKSSLISG